EQDRRSRPPSWLRKWAGDGMIARVETESVAAEIAQLKAPVVDVSSAQLVEGIPCVKTNEYEIAQLVVRSFAGRALRNLAYCGEPIFAWSRRREEAFVALSEESGCECRVFRGKAGHERGHSPMQERRLLKEWIQSLPKPVGIMACYDFRGHLILDVCRELRLRVPEDVAVIAVDNDERLCEICTPGLSSVVPDAFGAGYEAACLLHRMMSGEQVDLGVTLKSPLGIVERKSSDIYAIDDEDVVNAARLIRNHACEGLSVADVLKAVPLSRRSLEYRFRRHFGRTPHEEIMRVRIERARTLLRETDFSLAAIALRTGFANADYLSVVFKKAVGQPPSQFRAEWGRSAKH
ncbi:MAG: XylR family transcriptional regulator, partial [Planctomycetales bacterium]|nr:XylR family transcriptional regulator [Planctomycetales bacterium]